MSSEYFDGYQSHVSHGSTTSPAGTPYETPPLSRSRQSSRRATPRESSSSPPSVSNHDSPRRTESTVFAMDPKRLTPTLQASLVSEILTLRRELDSKHHFISDLESTLEAERNKNEELNEQLSRNNKDSRLATQRFRSLENGALNAVEDLARERDEAQTAGTELKAKLEILNKRARKQEEDAVQTQRSWEAEKQSWENERRQLERRVHVTETRLRAFVDGVNAHQVVVSQQEHDNQTALEESLFKDSGLGNDSDTESVRTFRAPKHRRNQSSVSFISIPAPHGSPSKGGTGKNLADELGGDAEDDYDLDDDSDDGDEELFAGKRLGRCSSALSLAQSAKSDSKAKRLLGLSDDASTHGRSNSGSSKGSGSAKTSGTSRPGSIPEMAAQLGLQMATAYMRYVDHGVQSSRPPSPAKLPAEVDEAIPKTDLGHDTEKWQLDAVGIPGATHAGSREVKDNRASLAIQQQQTNAPLSPPGTPTVHAIPLDHENHGSRTTTPASEYASSSTQTYVLPSQPQRGIVAKRASAAAPDDLTIPSIAIHPPLSSPRSPGAPLLPPGTVDSSVQTDPSMTSTSCDVSVQTEEIRIDRRPVKLPRHLLPRSIDSPRRRGSSERSTVKMVEIAGPPSLANGPRRNLEKLPLKAINLPRPVLLAASDDVEKYREDSAARDADQSSSGGAGLATLLDPYMNRQNAGDSADDYASDKAANDMFGTTPGLARHATRTTFHGPPKTVPEDREISPAHGPYSFDATIQQGRSARKDSDSSSPGYRPQSSRGPRNLSRSSRGGSRFHTRSGSTTSISSSSRGLSSQDGPTQLPPFPIPLRSSSRARGGAASDGGSSPVRHDFNSLRSRRSDRDLYRKSSLRKAHSSSSLKSTARMSPRRRRRGPELTPIQSMAFDDAPEFDVPRHIEPIPFSPLAEENHAESKHNPSSNDCAPEDHEQETAIVDAIAATMVGEWMWKYVRRRKSFGVGETTPGEDGLNGTRHKRWVWLSPYERTIMWSSKQPNSGNALLGKNGRRLTIKTVLDVKDETAPPKSATGDGVFHRSILIIAPERALKFTAPSRERHYLWLTALSFLAQSGRGPPQVPLVPPPEPTEQLVQKQRRQQFGFRKDAKQDPMRRHRQTPQQGVIKGAPIFGGPLHGSSIRNPAQPVSIEAEPPSIPRVPGYGHQRGRSSTNLVLPAPSISSGSRSGSSNAVTTTMTSTLARAPTDDTTNTSSPRQTVTATSRSGSGGTLSVASPDGPNLVEGTGTVRMEAFVDSNYQNGVLYVPAGPPPSQRNTRRRGESIRSDATTGDKWGIDQAFDETGKDPFTGF